MGGLSHENIPTGIIYGFLKSIPMFQERFDTPHVIFCWDSKTNKRMKMLSEYKSDRIKRRKEMEPDEVLYENEFRLQMKMLRRKYLKTIGFRNVFCQPGYEADDLIASVCRDLSEDDEGIIISSDQDLYQCLSPNISMYNPNKKKMMTISKLQKEYGIGPVDWYMMKAIAGCSTDNVSGVKGVGEKTAIKYLRGELKEHTKAYQNIISKKGMKIFARNRKLVKLPLQHTNHFALKKDLLSAKGWKEVINALGLKSIRDKVPMSIRRKKKTK